MKRIMFILGVSIIMALLTVTAALAGWWLGASLPLDRDSRLIPSL